MAKGMFLVGKKARNEP